MQVLSRVHSGTHLAGLPKLNEQGGGSMPLNLTVQKTNCGSGISPEWYELAVGSESVVDQVSAAERWLPAKPATDKRFSASRDSRIPLSDKESN